MANNSAQTLMDLGEAMKYTARSPLSTRCMESLLAELDWYACSRLSNITRDSYLSCLAITANSINPQLFAPYLFLRNNAAFRVAGEEGDDAVFDGNVW